MSLFGWPDDGPDAAAHDLFCHGCERTVRLHPDEPFVPQVHLFLEQHRSCQAPADDDDALV